MKQDEVLKKYSMSNIHSERIFDLMLWLAPIVAVLAAVLFTAGKYFGLFDEALWENIWKFDAVCAAYVVFAVIFAIIGKFINPMRRDGLYTAMKIVLTILLIFQWSLISYYFPSRELWGFAVIFVVISAFFFDSTQVLFTEIGIAVSTGVSWFLNGDQLLPVKDDKYLENLILRCIALILSFVCVYFFTRYGEKFKEKVDDHQGRLKAQNDSLRKMNTDIIRFTADMVEMRDEFSGSHIKRVEEYTRILAEKVMEKCPEYNLTELDVDMISQASMLHDVGKIYIADSILLKQDKLTDEEFKIMGQHTTIGAEIVENMPMGFDMYFRRYCKEICLCHHERYDGSGYPNKYKGEDIPISAQIVSVADCFDALTTKRPYKDALSVEVAADMIVTGKCGIFSDKIIDCFNACLEQFETVVNSVSD